MLPWPINNIGKIYERLSLRLYKNSLFWTDSPSTKKDLMKFSIPEQNITIIPCAVDNYCKRTQKKDKSTILKLLFVGRLVPMKGVETAIQVCAEVKRHIKDVSLSVVGDGEETYKSYLSNLVSRLQLSEQVRFLGRLSEEDKTAEYQTAHFLLHFSVREGFGLVVLEANQQGTPVIAHDAPGLRDIVVSGENGYLVPLNDVRAASEIIIKQFEDTSVYFELSQRSRKFAAQYQWPSILPLSLTLLLRACNLTPGGHIAKH
jgi:glycosyltransferase involved in cell wall biosynthesis